MNVTQYVAGGDIYPCRFIKQSAAGAFTVVQATANSANIGVSGVGTTMVPIVGMTDASCVYCARIGMNVPYFGEHDECLVEAGATFVAGDYLVSDADGKAIKATSGSTNISAVALEAATAAGQKIRVRVEYQRGAIPS